MTAAQEQKKPKEMADANAKSDSEGDADDDSSLMDKLFSGKAPSLRQTRTKSKKEKENAAAINNAASIDDDSLVM